MIYIKNWIKQKSGTNVFYYYKGVFLFGFIPLYIVRVLKV